MQNFSVANIDFAFPSQSYFWVETSAEFCNPAGDLVKMNRLTSAVTFLNEHGHGGTVISLTGVGLRKYEVMQSLRRTEGNAQPCWAKTTAGIE